MGPQESELLAASYGGVRVARYALPDFPQYSDLWKAQVQVDTLGFVF